MEKKQRQFIPGLSILLLAILLLGGVGSLLHDSRGVAYGAVGALIWGGAVLFSFLLGVIYLSRRLLPLRGNVGWSEGFFLLWRNYLLGITSLINGQNRKPSEEALRKKKGKPPELSPSFKYLGAGFLPSHQAAAIKKGTRYSRAVGPGLAFLHPGESIGQVFDLRPQVRRESVSANTRDGIPIETSVSVTFRVRRPSGEARPERAADLAKIPYPFSQSAIFDLNYAGSVGGADGKQNWSEQVAPQAAALLVSEISRYNLDELMMGAGTEALAKIRQSIKDALERQQGDDEWQTLPRGIEILGVGVGLPQLSQDVLEKRLTTWQVEWQNRVREEQITGDIESQRLFHRARARAQIENIENLLVSIDAMHQQNPVELHEVVMNRLMSVLEHMSADRALDPLATRPMLISLAQEVTSEMRTVLEKNEK